MALIYSPATGTTQIVEFTGTTGTTVTASYDAGEAGSSVVTITNVTYADTVMPIPEDLTLTWSGNSFTFSSIFDDLFYRELKYLVYDEDNVTLEEPYNVKTYLKVYRFKDLPDLYTGIYEFVPSPINIRSIPFNISYTAEVTVVDELGGSSSTTESGTETWTFSIVEDFEVVIQKLLNAVNDGSRYNFAKTKYPELEL